MMILPGNRFIPPRVMSVMRFYYGKSHRISMRAAKIFVHYNEHK
jgi:hypothetical protein